MSNQLKLSATTSGMTVYAVVFNSAGQFWNTSGTPVFEAENDSHWANYKLALAEAGTTAIYLGSFPAGITAAGVYYVQFRQQAGASAALSDAVLATGQILWTGTAEAFPLSTADSNATDVPFSDGLPNVNVADSSGTGSIAINQDTGGADNLRYVDTGGNGVEGASVLIYLASDWPANPDRVQAMATTGPDGRWISPAFVDTGTYVAVFTKIGVDGPDVSGTFSV